MKQEELSEMVIRKDLAESKLGNVHKDYALNTEKLQVRTKPDSGKNLLTDAILTCSANTTTARCC